MFLVLMAKVNEKNLGGGGIKLSEQRNETEMKSLSLLTRNFHFFDEK